ncbi:MAG: squalene cyclase [Propionibacteriaceae bacterium]
MTLDDVENWLLDSDPTLRWQVERDLLGAPPETWQATRARIPTKGHGARLLAAQDADGQWAGGAYFPAGFFDDPANQELPGQPWTATTWSLTTLREWGMDPAPLKENDTADLIARHSRWEYDDLPYWGGEVDVCINAMTLANGWWLGADVDALPGWFVEHQLPDGGWNCEWVEGSTRSSVHSTLNALKGLLAYEEATGGTEATRTARRAGEEYLLERRLRYRMSTGAEVGSWVHQVAYPFRHVCSPLHAAEYFRRAAGLDRTSPDPRLAETIEVIRAARSDDGTWPQGTVLPGAVWFDLDVPEGEPSEWITLHALRILRWWDGEAARASA